MLDRRTLACTALLAACSPQPPACPASQEAELIAHIAELRAALARSSTIFLPAIDLPRVATHGLLATEGLLTTLDRRGLRIDDERASSWQDGAQLREAARRQAAFGRPLTLVAAIAGDVPARDVEVLLRVAARAGFTHVSIAATPADDPPLPPARERELAATLHKTEPTRRAEVLADLLAAEVTRCPQLGAPLTGERSAEAILNLTERTLLTCACAADVDRVLTLVHVAVLPERVTMFSPRMSLGASTDELVAEPDALWSTLAAAAFEPRAGFALRLRGEPP